MIDRNKLMRSLVLALALLFAAPLMGMAAPGLGVSAARAQTVSKISVSGNHQVDTATIVGVLSVKVGEPSSAAKLSESTAALYKTGFFKTVSVTQSGGIVFVKVTENSMVAAVLFQGNQRFSDAELMSMVQVSSRGGYSNEQVQADVDTIRSAYSKAGYTNVTVTPQTVADSGRTRITFVIN